MKASELIKELERFIVHYGNKDVVMHISRERSGVTHSIVESEIVISSRGPEFRLRNAKAIIR